MHICLVLALHLKPIAIGTFSIHFLRYIWDQTVNNENDNMLNILNLQQRDPGIIEKESTNDD